MKGRPERAGARDEAQLWVNPRALGCSLTADHIRRLDDASATTLPYSYRHQRGVAERILPAV